MHWQSPDELSRAASTSPSATLIVADPRMHFLRRSAHTEMIDEGRLSATQLDRLTGILKDKPIKKGLLLPRSYSRYDAPSPLPSTSVARASATPLDRLHLDT